MKGTSVLYISNQCISVVEAEVKRDAMKIIDCFQIPLNEGTMLNGVIIDDNELKNALSQVSDRGIHEVHLIVDSAKIIAKTASVPRMKESEHIQFVKDELSSVDSSPEDNVYDFSYLCPDNNIKGASKILCVSVDREFIENYLNIFKEVEIDILSIDYAINSLISLVKKLPGFIDKTYAISQIDGQNMISALFVNNEYTLTNRTRIFASRGTEEYENELIGTVSQLKQFASSSSQDKPISDLYFFGLNREEEMSVFSKMSEVAGLPAHRLPASKAIYVEKKDVQFDINDYAYCIGYFNRK